MIAWFRKLAATSFQAHELLELTNGTALEGTWGDYQAGDFPHLCTDLLGIASARAGELLELLERRGIIEDGQS
jgi:hypothetical protein